MASPEVLVGEVVELFRAVEGSSVEVAISSSRDVAASSLGTIG